MHIQRSQDIVFSNNHILGSRMGAFFLAEFCKNATITANIVDGGNGSRVISVEKSTEDVTMVGNTFRNGGRGAWINQPRNLIIQGNIFINNTTKNDPDPRLGRIAYRTALKALRRDDPRKNSDSIGFSEPSTDPTRDTELNDWVSQGLARLPLEGLTVELAAGAARPKADSDLLAAALFLLPGGGAQGADGGGELQ